MDHLVFACSRQNGSLFKYTAQDDVMSQEGNWRLSQKIEGRRWWKLGVAEDYFYARTRSRESALQNGVTNHLWVQQYSRGRCYIDPLMNITILHQKLNAPGKKSGEWRGATGVVPKGQAQCRSCCSGCLWWGAYDTNLATVQRPSCKFLDNAFVKTAAKDTLSGAIWSERLQPDFEGPIALNTSLFSNGYVHYFSDMPQRLLLKVKL